MPCSVKEYVYTPSDIDILIRNDLRKRLNWPNDKSLHIRITLGSEDLDNVSCFVIEHSETL